MQDPPFPRSLWLFRADSGRVSRFGVQSILGCPSDLTSRQEGFAMHFGDEAPDSKTGLIMGYFLFGGILDHEGRGTGKKTTSGGREKHAFFRKRRSLQETN